MISVIIPTYNREKTIKESVESVLNQSYRDIEVIVVDDCSQDSTIQVLESIDDKRLKYYVLPENLGACAARNLGISKSQGEYIAFHDSDDVCRPDKLAHQKKALEANQADIVFCAIEKHGYKKNEKSPNIAQGFKTFENILMGMYVSTQTIFGKREVFEKYQFDESIKRMQDYDIMIRISQTEKVYFLDEVLVDLYLQNDSITKTQRTYNIPEKFFSKYPELAIQYPKWKARLLSRSAKEYTIMGKDTKLMYKEIYYYDKNVKNLFKYILAVTGMLKAVYKLS